MRTQVLVAVTALLPSIAAAQALPTFKKIADGNGTAVINESGKVAWTDSRAVYVGDGSTVQTYVSLPADPFLPEGLYRLGSDVAINDLDEVAFTATYKTGYNPIPGEVITISDGANLRSLDTMARAKHLSLNNRGEVAFVGVPESHWLYDWTWKVDGTSRLFIGEGPNNSWYGPRSHPILNNNGVVGYVSGYPRPEGEPVSYEETIVAGDGLSLLEVILDTLGEPLGHIGAGPSLAFNDNKDVAFVADLDGGGQGVFATRNGVLTELARTGAMFRLFWQSISMNNVGTVAFVGAPVGPLVLHGTSVLYVASRCSNSPRRVIGVGDHLFGGRVEMILISQDAINDSHEIAFTAYLEENGAYRFVIVRGEIRGLNCM